ncbi:putative lipid II flippase FtsW [Brevibacterium daeguense]|uniref:Probable peptidoglycan glycosyltransferase FtsW n=1 Tax=Brevibacterium daeguense TaxID=909936 RepID=A0ABP8EMQ8_9MICO|nr:putative lipid II flippase FtsW [Brevibacterium daeguense]
MGFLGIPTRSSEPRVRRTTPEDFIRSGSGVWASVRRLLELPVTSYYIVLFATLALTALGLIMVLSASSIVSYDGGEGSSFTLFNRQLVFALIGLFMMFTLSLAPLRFWRFIAGPAIILGMLLQVLPFIPGLGQTVNGSTSWVEIGGVQAQPAEFVKVALALWLGVFLANKATKLHSIRELMPAVAVLGIVLGFILYGRDLGTGIIIMGLALGALFVGGVPWRYFFAALAAILAVVAVMVLTSANRMARIKAMFTGGDSAQMDALGQHWQSNHGLFALASGGWFGVGLGASREKWSWLPEAHNDFIFAIIGEELGLVGSFIVILLFLVLGYGLIRILMRTDDRFVQATTAGVFVWLIGQAAVNIGVVAGVLPVIGVPLPLVSYGGSALIATLIAVGMMLSFARAEAGALEAMRAQSSRVRRSLAVLARRPARRK